MSRVLSLRVLQVEPKKNMRFPRAHARFSFSVDFLHS